MTLLTRLSWASLTLLGTFEGVEVGTNVGPDEGTFEGAREGVREGMLVGAPDGTCGRTEMQQEGAHICPVK